MTTSGGVLHDGRIGRAPYPGGRAPQVQVFDPRPSASRARRPPERLDLVACERVADLGLGGLVAGAEPVLALLRGAVRERVRVDRAAGPALETVVADGLGGAERFVEVAVLQIAGAEHRAGPDAGVAVGLQLEADGQRVGLPRVVLLQAAHLLADAGQALDV